MCNERALQDTSLKAIAPYLSYAAIAAAIVLEIIASAVVSLLEGTVELGRSTEIAIYVAPIVFLMYSLAYKYFYYTLSLVDSKKGTKERKEYIGFSKKLKKGYNVGRQIYVSAVDGLLARSSVLIGDSHRKNPAWSRESYGACITLAFIYPLLFPVVAWFISGEVGYIGKLLDFPESIHWLYRLMLFLFISLLVISIERQFNLGAEKINLHLAVAMLSMPIVFLLGSMIPQEGLITANYVLVAGILIVLYVSKKIGLRNVRIQLIYFGICFWALGYFLKDTDVMVAGTAMQLISLLLFTIEITKSMPDKYLPVWCSFCGTLLLLCLLLIVPWVFSYTKIWSDDLQLLTVFITVIVLNSFFDWVSLSATRQLIYFGRDKGPKFQILAWLVDVVLIVVILTILSICLLVSVQVINYFSAASVQDPFSIEKVLDSLSSSNESRANSENAWLFAMVFTTAIPTFLHMFIASFSILNSWALVNEVVVKKIPIRYGGTIIERDRWVFSMLLALQCVVSFIASVLILITAMYVLLIVIFPKLGLGIVSVLQDVHALNILK